MVWAGERRGIAQPSLLLRRVEIVALLCEVQRAIVELQSELRLQVFRFLCTECRHQFERGAEARQHRFDLDLWRRRILDDVRSAQQAQRRQIGPAPRAGSLGIGPRRLGADGEKVHRVAQKLARDLIATL